MSIRELIPWRSRGSQFLETEFPLANLQREMDALFDAFARTNGLTSVAGGRFVPAVNVSENPEAFRVTAELPGMDLKDVSVRLENGSLVLTGRKDDEKEEKGRGWYRKERSCGEFHRAIGLPPGIEESKVTATFAKGVLTVDVPKAREALAKSRVIDVKTA